MRSFAFCVFLLCAALAFPAAAGVIYESATLGPIGQTGGSSVDDTQFLGARFEITETTSVTAIGGHLLAFDASPIFGAIIALDSMTAMPHGSPFDSGEVVASTTFNAGYTGFPSFSSDVRTPLSVTLTPGAYALVFGSGQFGASGWAAMPNNNTDLAGASYFWWGSGAWHNPDSGGVRFVVEGDTAVPEPATLALVGLALGGLALVRRLSW